MGNKRNKKPKSIAELVINGVLASAALIASVAQLIQALR